MTAEEQADVGQTVTTTTDRRLGERGQAVLMAPGGRKRQAMAAELGVQRTTVKKGLDQSRVRGLAGLQVRRAPGKPHRLPEALAPTIIAGVKTGPQGWGLNRANGTDEELAGPGYRPVGSAIKRTALRDCCQRPQSRPSRPTDR